MSNLIVKAIGICMIAFTIFFALFLVLADVSFLSALVFMGLLVLVLAYCVIAFWCINVGRFK